MSQTNFVQRIEGVIVGVKHKLTSRGVDAQKAQECTTTEGDVVHKLTRGDLSFSWRVMDMDPDTFVTFELRAAGKHGEYDRDAHISISIAPLDENSFYSVSCDNVGAIRGTSSPAKKVHRVLRDFHRNMPTWAGDKGPVKSDELDQLINILLDTFTHT